MIAYSFNNDKGNINNKLFIEIENIKKDINLLKDFSSILEIVNIRKLDNISFSYDILLFIKAYELLHQINDYSSFQCPLCGKKNILNFHKQYQRDCIFYVGNYEITAIVNITVVECSFCKENKEHIQHYHAILPSFLFPYHIYSSNIILDTIYQKEINQIKLNVIMSQRNISHQLLYGWLKGMKKYQLSASTILELPNVLEKIIIDVRKNLEQFLKLFYEQYHHSFFLFRLTCVPLVIVP